MARDMGRGRSFGCVDRLISGPRVKSVICRGRDMTNGGSSRHLFITKKALDYENHMISPNEPYPIQSESTTSLAILTLTLPDLTSTRAASADPNHADIIISDMMRPIHHRRFRGRMHLRDAISGLRIAGLLWDRTSVLRRVFPLWRRVRLHRHLLLALTV